MKNTCTRPLASHLVNKDNEAEEMENVSNNTEHIHSVHPCDVLRSTREVRKLFYVIKNTAFIHVANSSVYLQFFSSQMAYFCPVWLCTNDILGVASGAYVSVAGFDL